MTGGSSATDDTTPASDERHRAFDGRLREILDDMQLVAVFLDTDGVVVYCNDTCCDLLGCADGEVVGQDWFDRFVPEEQRKAARESFLGGIEHGRARGARPEPDPRRGRRAPAHLVEHERAPRRGGEGRRHGVHRRRRHGPEARRGAAAARRAATTPSPACPTAACSSTASPGASRAPSCAPSSASPRCSWTSTASSSSTTASATVTGDELLVAIAPSARRMPAAGRLPWRAWAATSSPS